MGSLSCMALRCFLRQHDKQPVCHPGVHCHPGAFVIPTKEGSAIREQQFQATNLYSLMRCFNGGSLLCMPFRCFLRQHDKQPVCHSNVLCHPGAFVIPTKEGSTIQEQQFQATNLYSLMRCFNGIAFMHGAQMLPSSA